jgi:dCTP deaminase
MSVWNDRKISEWAQSGGVAPFDAACVNPASLDLRLGNKIRRPHHIWDTMHQDTMGWLHALGLLDQIPKWSDPIEFTEWLLYPGDFVLCSSLEFVNVPDDVITLLFSKSSTGRIGLEHLHAGLGDCGWHDANWTWELHNVAPWPIPLVAGKRIMQQIMVKMTDYPLRTYAETGRYNNQSGPTPARAEKKPLTQTFADLREKFGDGWRDDNAD